jgi:hypothetical protein
VLANLLRPGLDAVLNISTSAQLAFVMPEEFHPEHLRSGTIVQLQKNDNINLCFICSYVLTL